MQITNNNSDMKKRFFENILHSIGICCDYKRYGRRNRHIRLEEK